jgi:hypothetical protein
MFYKNSKSRAVALGLLGLTACQGSETASGLYSAKMRVQMKEAAPWVDSTAMLVDEALLMEDETAKVEPLVGNATSALLEILRVDLYSVSDGQWYRVPIDPIQIDLLNLGNGFGQVLARARVPAGTYDQIRLLTADSGVVAFPNGESKPLIVPSGRQTGIKFKFSSAVEVKDCTLTGASLEIDVSNSFVSASGKVLFKPVVRANVEAPYSLGTCSLAGGGGAPLPGGGEGSSLNGPIGGEASLGGGDADSGTGGAGSDGGSEWIDVIGI